MPDFLIDKDGGLATFMNLRPTDNGEINFVVPEGIGDDGWIISKLWSICEKRDCMFYFNQGIYSRVGPYLDLMGLKWRQTSVDSRELLSFPGEYKEGDFDNGGNFYL